MSEENYELCESFGIDNGELAGLSPQDCFVLGVEWSDVRQAAELPEAFTRPVHIANRDRIKSILDRRDRRYTLTYMDDDVSENWLWLAVFSRQEG